MATTKISKIAADEYDQFFKANTEDTLKKRKESYTNVVNDYYDLVTLFYEYGWGCSFHFAPMNNQDSFQTSIARHEHYLALKLGLKEEMKVLDVGCGVGGPLIEISRFSGAQITGLNNNDFQIKRGQKLLQKAGLQDRCSFLKADFMNIPVSDNTYDSIYAIEATCHAPDKVKIYSEIWRVLKPGSYFAAYEWCMTDKYDPNNEQHNKIKYDIELGDGIPNLDTTAVVLEALKKAKFNIIQHKDLAITDTINPIPWYVHLESSYLSLNGIKFTWIGNLTSKIVLGGLQKLKIAPEGTLRAHDILLTAADGLSKGGREKIFTPMFFFLVQKPKE